MSLNNFLARLRNLNITIWLENDTVRYKAPQGVMTGELLSKLKERRAEIINFLKQANAYFTIEQAPKLEYYPVSASQKRFYILNQIEGASTGYNISGATRIEGKLDPNRLAEVFKKLVQRHEAFRVTFDLVSGALVQRIHPEAELAIDFQELEENKVADVINQFIQPFDLSRAPLLRIKLLKVAQDKHILIYDMHHIISDLMSMSLLVREFIKLYQGEDLPELRIQYKDFAYWQNNAGLEIIKRQEEYWLKNFAGEIQRLELPVDYPRPAAPDFQGATVDFWLDETLTGQLRKLATVRKTTLFMTLLAGYNLFLARLTGATEITVGATIAGRHYPELENVFGMFVNTLPLKNRVGISQTFVEFLDELRQNTMKAFENQDYQYEMLLDKLKIPIDLNSNPLFNTLFNPQTDFNTSYYQFEADGLNFSHYESKSEVNTFTFDMMILINETGNSIQLNCIYRSSLFRRATIEYLINEYIRLLREVVLDPEKQLQDYRVFNPRDISHFRPPIRIKAPYREFEAEAVQRSLVERFEEQVREYPNHIAAQVGSRERVNALSYEVLNKKANQLARLIEDKLNGPEPVALLFGNDPEMFTGIVGVLKAGRAYLPLDPTYPEARLAYMLSDSGAALMVTNHQNATFAAELSRARAQTTGKEIHIIEIEKINADTPDHDLHKAIKPEQVAYIKYTSGSTGKPKGIPQTHRNVLAFIRRYTNELHINSTDKVAMFSSYSHSAGAIDVFSMLLNGGTLYPYDLKSEGNMRKVTDWLIAEGITIFHSAPMIYRYCTESLAIGEKIPRVRLVVLGGEPILKKDAERMKRYFGEDCVLVNMFGATEVIIGTFGIAGCDTEITGAQVPVGYPVEEVDIYLINEDNREAPVFGTGEIVYESDYLALDYLNLPEKSAEAYRSNPLTGTGRAFWSGDLGRMLPDGRIEFLGRKDFQVKIRGYRIELGEIEAVLDDIPGIHKSVVAGFEKTEGDYYLAAYYTVNGAKEPEKKEMRRLLGLKLPDYMIPSYFVPLEQLPLTPTGKVDRKALLKPESAGIDTGDEYEAPQNETEAKLVEIWREALGVEKIGVNDNFFDLGGHSLKAITISDLCKKKGIDLPVQAIFRYTTIAMICKNLDLNTDTSNGKTPEDKAGEAVAGASGGGDTDGGRVSNMAGMSPVKELPVKLQRNVNTYLFRSFPLCVILAYDKFLPWYNHHLIQIYAQIHHDGYIMLDYLEKEFYFTGIMDCFECGIEGLKEIDDIVNFIIEKIDNVTYVKVYLDEYYLKFTPNYLKEHFVHENFVYGYDKTHKRFRCIAFENEIFDTVDIEYDVVVTAYESAKNRYKDTALYMDEHALQLFTPREFEREVPFDPGRFMSELDDYISSRGDKGRTSFMCTLQHPWQPNIVLLDENLKYGLEAETLVVEKLERMAAGEILMDYRAIHLLAEHKKELFAKFQYIIKRYGISGEDLKTVDQYQTIVDDFETIRLKSFEIQHAVSFENALKILPLIIAKMKSAIEMERPVLREIYGIFEANFKSHEKYQVSIYK